MPWVSAREGANSGVFSRVVTLDRGEMPTLVWVEERATRVPSRRGGRGRQLGMTTWEGATPKAVHDLPTTAEKSLAPSIKPPPFLRLDFFPLSRYTFDSRIRL